MRFITIAALAFAATVSAQDTSATATSTSLSPQATCLAACMKPHHIYPETRLIFAGDSSDICCQAACVNVPCPNEADVNATTECAGQCQQGNGTQEETEAYASCQSSCISSNFLTATGGAAAATATGTAATTTGTGNPSSSGVLHLTENFTNVHAPYRHRLIHCYRLCYWYRGDWISIWHWLFLRQRCIRHREWQRCSRDSSCYRCCWSLWLDHCRSFLVSYLEPLWDDDRLYQRLS